MTWLAIESSYETCSVALGDADGGAERFAHDPRGHASHLLPWVDELLDDAGMSLRDLEGIVFARGPGSFTSLRIGIGVVQGLAFGADLRVVPVSSLAATAQAAADSAAAETLVVAMDARMDEVYAAVCELQEGRVTATGDEWLGPPDQLPATMRQALDSGARAVGNGFARYAPLAALAPDALTDAWPTARALLQLADPGHAVPADQAQPVYLRDRVAERPTAP